MSKEREPIDDLGEEIMQKEYAKLDEGVRLKQEKELIERKNDVTSKPCPVSLIESYGKLRRDVERVIARVAELDKAVAERLLALEKKVG